MKTQDQVTNIFTKPLKYDVFAKMRDMLGEELRQLILKGSVEIQYQLGFRLIGFRVYKNFNIS